MNIEEKIPLIDHILDEWKRETRDNHQGYRNHVYRMVNFCFALGEFGEEAREKIVIAGSFHDIGIWTGKTFDYLPPSIELAKDYLGREGLNDWIPEIELMIDQHHKLGKYTDNKTVEVFRQGDLVDFSLGIVKCGLPSAFVKEVKSKFSNAGFHKGLVKRAGKWFCRHPLNPLPVLKW